MVAISFISRFLRFHRKIFFFLTNSNNCCSIPYPLLILKGREGIKNLILASLKLSYEEWEMDNRWSAEVFFHGVKRVFGETCRSKSQDTSVSESQDEICLLQYALQYAVRSLDVSPREQTISGDKIKVKRG